MNVCPVHLVKTHHYLISSNVTWFDYVFQKFKSKKFLKLIGSIVNNTERINTKKEHTQLVHVTDPLIIPMIFIFLSCLEKAHA